MVDQLNNTVKTTKEKSQKSIVYSHECPYCGEDIDEYTESAVDQRLECICGESYEVVK